MSEAQALVLQAVQQAEAAAEGWADNLVASRLTAIDTAKAASEHAQVALLINLNPLDLDLTHSTCSKSARAWLLIGQQCFHVCLTCVSHKTAYQAVLASTTLVVCCACPCELNTTSLTSCITNASFSVQACFKHMRHVQPSKE